MHNSSTFIFRPSCFKYNIREKCRFILFYFITLFLIKILSPKIITKNAAVKLLFLYIYILLTSNSPLWCVCYACATSKGTLSRSNCRICIILSKTRHKMPDDYDKAAYPEPPRQTPAVDKQTALPNPALILSKLFYYTVDLPVTTFRGKRS